MDAREPLNMTARAELPERPERRGMGLGETLHRQRKTCEAGVGRTVGLRATVDTRKSA